jgi:hypothetical protein
LEAQPASDAYALTHFYDEGLSHYLWYLGIIGMAALLMIREWSGLFEHAPQTLPVLVAAVIYGITTFITTIESGTVPLILPFSVAVGSFFVWRGYRRMHSQPLIAFFGMGYALAAVLMIGWGIYWRGFPQFSELGIIH